MEPFGQERDNYHAAQVASVVAQVNGNKLSVRDFMYEDAETVAQRQVEKFFGKFDRMKESGQVN